MIDQQLGTVVIGGSQAGLAVGYFLKQRDLPFVILDENDIVSTGLSKTEDAVARATSAGRQYG